MQRPRQSDQLISVNNARRVCIYKFFLFFCEKLIALSTFCVFSLKIYSLDDVECSELCFCADSLVLTCHALCVPIAPCRTSLAFYAHASPAYQAFRGRCLCYSGNFICMRPSPGEYSLPPGKMKNHQIIIIFIQIACNDQDNNKLFREIENEQ